MLRVLQLRAAAIPAGLCKWCRQPAPSTFVLGTSDRANECRRCQADGGASPGPRARVPAPAITCALMVVNSPWGNVETRDMIAPGVVFVSTSSHGGALAAPEAQARIPESLRTADGWYEEDCELCAVIVTWPEYFDARAVAMARGAVASGREWRMSRGGRYQFAS